MLPGDGEVVRSVYVQSAWRAEGVSICGSESGPCPATPMANDQRRPGFLISWAVCRSAKMAQRSWKDEVVIEYRIGNQLNTDEVIELYRASTLGERRPVDDRDRMGQMIGNANLVITAWDGELLVGISRSLTDFSYVTYLSDLAVRLSHQRHGIGKELIRRTKEESGPQAAIVLLSAPNAADYYPHVGFTHHPQAWILR
jgi:GNAT superfamily N-acetyltransferase